MRDVTSYALRRTSPDKTRADLVVVGIASSGKGPVVVPGGEAVEKAYGRRFAPMLSSLGVSGKAGQSVRVPTGGTLTSPMLLLVGVGERDRLAGNPGLEAVRRAAAVAGRDLGNAASVALALPMHDLDHLRAVAEGFVAGRYRFAGFHQNKPSQHKVAEVALITDLARRKDATDLLEEVRTVAALTGVARDWVNLPANLLRPPDFADRVRELHREQGKGLPVTVTVLEEDELAELGCGGILGVGQGSSAPPRLVKVVYEPKDARSHVALVGKGITFDSGGLTIKPPTSMTTMKEDMAGAAAVIAATFAVARLGVPVKVTCYAPMAENMLSGSAMRPGDVLTTYGGRTVEVRNTDAEGRLILADALAMAAEEQPDLLVDVATLTGHMVVALGTRIAGALGDDEPVAEVLAAARRTGESFHRMPIPEHTLEAVQHESEIADVLQHNWVRWGGGSWAAAFLKVFAGDAPFVHLDVAGPSFNEGAPWGVNPSGGTGFGVRTLVALVQERAGETVQDDTE